MKNKYNITPLGVVTLAASAIIFAYYFIYLILCLVGVEALKMLLLAIFVMACVTLPILLRTRLKHLLKRAYKPLHIIFTVLLCVYIVTVIAFWAYIGFDASKTPSNYITAYASQQDTGEDTVIMVFGCYTNGMTPGYTLKLRLDAAYELLEALPDATCIVSGSQGTTETVPESVAMRGYLVDLGIAEERIIIEDSSHSTSENIRFCKAVLEELGLSNKRIIGVSTAFHLPRIEMLSNRYDLPMDTCASPSPSFAYHYVSMIREYLSYIKMALFDEAVFITKIS